MKKHVDQNELITGKKKKKFSVGNLILVLIILVGLSVMLYPTVSDWWNSFHQSQAINSYKVAIEEMSQEEFDRIWQQAEDYNTALKKLGTPLSSFEELEKEYNDALNVSGNGMIGYIDIPSIDVSLPVYHGTSDAVLNVAAGHLEGSTLPIGGETTHAVISAHRGLPSAKLFTDLDDLVEGDTFTLTILNQTLMYVVDQIMIVEPDQMEALSIIQGQDYVTLMTCTPYGINTHRLFVRGHRIETEEENRIVVSEARKIEPVVVAVVVGTPILIFVLLSLIIHYSKKKDMDLESVRVKIKDTNKVSTDTKEDTDEE